MKGTGEDDAAVRLSAAVVGVLMDLDVPFKDVEHPRRPREASGHQGYSDWPPLLQLYVAGQFVGPAVTSCARCTPRASCSRSSKKRCRSSRSLGEHARHRRRATRARPATRPDQGRDHCGHQSRAPERRRRTQERVRLEREARDPKAPRADRDRNAAHEAKQHTEHPPTTPSIRRFA